MQPLMFNSNIDRGETFDDSTDTRHVDLVPDSVGLADHAFEEFKGGPKGARVRDSGEPFIVVGKFTSFSMKTMKKKKNTKIIKEKEFNNSNALCY